MNTTGAKNQSRFFTGHFSMAEYNSICKSGMGSIRVTKNGYFRRGSIRSYFVAGNQHENLDLSGNTKCDRTMTQR